MNLLISTTLRTLSSVLVTHASQVRGSVGAAASKDLATWAHVDAAVTMHDSRASWKVSRSSLKGPSSSLSQRKPTSSARYRPASRKYAAASARTGRFETMDDW